MIICSPTDGSEGCGGGSGGASLRWPTPSDLNTRLRRIIAGYQRVVKKQELKKAAAEKVKTIQHLLILYAPIVISVQFLFVISTPSQSEKS